MDAIWTKKNAVATDLLRLAAHVESDKHIAIGDKFKVRFET